MKNLFLFKEKKRMYWCRVILSCFSMNNFRSGAKLIYIFKLQVQQQSATGESELAIILGKLEEKFRNSLNMLAVFQAKNSENVFNTGYNSHVIHYSWRGGSFESSYCVIIFTWQLGWFFDMLWNNVVLLKIIWFLFLFWPTRNCCIKRNKHTRGGE